MLSNHDVQEVLTTHVTKYQQRTGIEAQILERWKWSCTCGQDKLLETREMCVAETNNHWAAKIVELQPAEQTYADAPEKTDRVTPPSDFGILSFVIREVDCERMTMPEARRSIGQWFNKQDRSKVAELGRPRMRRLKQIGDAVNEEFLTLLGSIG